MSVLRHVIDSISPASVAQADRARAMLAGIPVLERIAGRIAGAQHTAKVRSAKRTIVVVAGDHGAGDPGVRLGASHPTSIAAHAIADGTAALAQVARASGTPFVLIDAGAAEIMPPSAVALGRGPTRNLLVEPAMTVVDASLALEQGIALAVSLSEPGLDLLAVGALGIGAEVAAAALRAARGIDVDGEAQAVAKGKELADASPLEQLANLGGAETAVLAGLLLGAASMNIPVILDGEATGTAAIVASALAPRALDYFLAAHAGARVSGLEPVFDVGLGHGDGTGAAMVIPLVDQVAAIAGRG